MLPIGSEIPDIHFLTGCKHFTVEVIVKQKVRRLRRTCMGACRADGVDRRPVVSCEL